MIGSRDAPILERDAQQLREWRRWPVRFGKLAVRLEHVIGAKRHIRGDANPSLLSAGGSLERGPRPFVNATIGAGQSNRPKEQDALPVDGGEEGTAGKRRLCGQPRPEGAIDKVGFPIFLQFDDGRLQVVGRIGMNADEPGFIRLADGDSEQRFLDADAPGEVAGQRATTRGSESDRGLASRAARRSALASPGAGVLFTPKSNDVSGSGSLACGAGVGVNTGDLASLISPKGNTGIAIRRGVVPVAVRVSVTSLPLAVRLEFSASETDSPFRRTLQYQQPAT